MISSPARFLAIASGVVSCGQPKKVSGVAPERSKWSTLQICTYGTCRCIGTISRKRNTESNTSACTPVSSILPGKCFSAARSRSGASSRVVYRTTSRPRRFATAPQLLSIEPGGYSFSQNGTKSRSAARIARSVSGTPMKTTSCPRDCNLRASAVIEFRCPGTGRHRKPIFIDGLIFEPHLQRLVLLSGVRREQMINGNVRWRDEHRLGVRQHVEAIFPVVVPHTCRPDTAERHRLHEQVDVDLVDRATAEG